MEWLLLDKQWQLLLVEHDVLVSFCDKTARSVMCPSHFNRLKEFPMFNMVTEMTNQNMTSAQKELLTWH